MLREHPPSIILKFRSRINPTGNRPTCIHLGFDVIGTSHNTVLLDSPTGVVGLGPTVAGLSGFRGEGWGAVHAFLHG